MKFVKAALNFVAIPLRRRDGVKNHGSESEPKE